MWARGDERITYAIVAGADDVPLGYPTVRRNYKVRGESRDLHWLSDGLLALKRNRRTVVITGSPPSEKLRRVMRAIAISV